MDSFYIWHKWSLSLEGVSRVTFFSESGNLKFWQIFETFRPWPWKKKIYNSRWILWFHSVRLSVRLSVRPSVRLSRLPCPLCNIYSSGWILSILATNDHYHERVCRTQWPLTLTYIFKVIRPWLRKSCPLCSLYSSGWILFIFGTNDHYH